MRVIGQIRTTFSVLLRAKHNRADLIRAIVRRPQLMLGVATYETAIMLSASVEARLKILAEMRVAMIVACEYCLDIGSALSRYEGVTEDQLREVHRYRSSEAFDETEKLAMELADALTRVPSSVDDELRDRLEARFTPTQLTELVAVIAWENQRARFNQGLGIRPSGFSDGEYCVLPEPSVV